MKIEVPKGGLGSRADLGTAVLSRSEVAKLHGVSKKMIYVIEQRALRKLRVAIEKECAAREVTPLEWFQECFD